MSSSITAPIIPLPLDPETLARVIRAGLPHANIGMNISSKAADAASVTINADGSATIGIPGAGLSLGAKGGGKGPRTKKAPTNDPRADESNPMNGG